MFDNYGYCADFDDADLDDSWLHSTHKSLHGPPGGFWFGASTFADIEVAFAVEFLCETHALDAEELWESIRVVCS